MEHRPHRNLSVSEYIGLVFLGRGKGSKKGLGGFVSVFMGFSRFTVWGTSKVHRRFRGVGVLMSSR